ncbi:R2-like ligand-binding oxidase [Bacillus sp. EB600]|uniref:R2-like ligand-binding oxidase n=1 Tax=Bacillus sp. EB600 TaxID=2806345 RepID=UPI00210B6D2B|nr:R2-like ligand-binding oxidase [Bacillus sp. EB600]MCQ6279601.1 R2-like ligand-binding oxidase [Bacillus sp. EB600]
MNTEKIVTLTRGINENSFTYQLFQKAKKFGIWNPSDIDFTQDKEDWKKLTPEQQETLRIRLSKFLVGEESVTHEIIPMIVAVGKKGWIEDEIFLTSFLWEEAKHVELFTIVLKELGEKGNIAYSSEEHLDLWLNVLPNIMNKLYDKPTNKEIAEASALYNMFQEGVQAETAYFLMYEGVNRLGLMPGLMQGIENLKRDEARHISFGTYLLQKLIREEPEIYQFVEDKMNEWWPIAEKLMFNNNVNSTAEDAFGIKISEVYEFARKQFDVRIEMLRRAVDSDNGQFVIK